MLNHTAKTSTLGSLDCGTDFEVAQLELASGTVKIGMLLNREVSLSSLVWLSILFCFYSNFGF